MQAWLSSVRGGDEGAGWGVVKLGPLSSALHAAQWFGPRLGYFIAGTNATVRKVDPGTDLKTVQ